MWSNNRLLLALAAVLVIWPLMMPSLKDAKFAGSDDQAGQVVEQAAPGYQPWFSPLWEPPSGEVASLLFALQAAAGAGFLGYFAGYRRGRAQQNTQQNTQAPQQPVTRQEPHGAA